MKCYLCNKLPDYSCSCKTPPILICRGDLFNHEQDKSKKHLFTNIEKLEEKQSLFIIKRKLQLIKKEAITDAALKIFEINERIKMLESCIHKLVQGLEDSYRKETLSKSIEAEIWNGLLPNLDIYLEMAQYYWILDSGQLFNASNKYNKLNSENSKNIKLHASEINPMPETINNLGGNQGTCIKKHDILQSLNSGWYCPPNYGYPQNPPPTNYGHPQNPPPANYGHPQNYNLNPIYSGSNPMNPGLNLNMSLESNLIPNLGGKYIGNSGFANSLLGRNQVVYYGGEPVKGRHPVKK